MAAPTPANTPHTGAQSTTPEHVVLDMATLCMQELRLPPVTETRRTRGRTLRADPADPAAHRTLPALRLGQGASAFQGVAATAPSSYTS